MNTEKDEENWHLAQFGFVAGNIFKKGKIWTAELWQEALAREKNRDGHLDAKSQGPERARIVRDHGAGQDMEEKKPYSGQGDGKTQVCLPPGQKELSCHVNTTGICFSNKILLQSHVCICHVIYLAYLLEKRH